MAFSNSVFRAVEAIFPRQQKNIFSINLPTVHWSMVLFRKRLSSRTCSCYVSGFTKTDVGLEGKSYFLNQESCELTSASVFHYSLFHLPLIKFVLYKIKPK